MSGTPRPQPDTTLVGAEANERRCGGGGGCAEFVPRSGGRGQQRAKEARRRGGQPQAGMGSGTATEGKPTRGNAETYSSPSRKYGKKTSLTFRNLREKGSLDDVRFQNLGI